MTLDYTKMFLIVTEEAVVKGHFASAGTVSLLLTQSFPSRKGRSFFAQFKSIQRNPAQLHRVSFSLL